MSYIYQADLYCDDCGEAIRDLLEADGNGVEDRDDECSYDSGDYPKGPFSDDEPADSPCHCASDAKCPNAVTLDDGRAVGAIVSGLTSDGRDYVLAAEDSPCSRLWRAHYDIGQASLDFGQAILAIFPIAILAKILFANF
jgi:hypothetical protein